MQEQVSTFSRLGIFGMLLIALCLVDVRSSATDRLKPEELIAKHLQSIGTATARSSVATRIIAGTSQVIFRTPPPGQATGRAVMASEGNKSLIGMSFKSPV